MKAYQVLVGDCLQTLRTLPKQTVQCCITSPPYWALRNYGVEGQLGQEKTPEEYITNLVKVFRAVRRVLRDDGVLWLNLGDTYRNKQQLLIPHRVALALQADGWLLRDTIIWCLSGGADVYVKTKAGGERPIMVKDLSRCDPSTVKLWNGVKWTQMLGMSRSNSKGGLELILRSGERIGCTPDHRWPTQRGLVSAGDLQIGDILQSVQLPEPKKHYPSHITDDLLWLVGLYLAEGSIAGDTVQLSLNADEIGWVPRIKSVARWYGGNAYYYLDGNSLEVKVRGNVIIAAINQYIAGRNAHTKCLRKRAWWLPNDKLKLLIMGYFDGDAHWEDSNRRYQLRFCRNYNLARDLRCVAARLGAFVRLTPVVYRTTKGCGFCGEWRWVRSGHGNEKDRNQIIRIGRSRARQFWDIGVEDDPHIFALASGVLTHNSKPNVMPQSVTDRTTTAHEYVFLLAKQPKYFFDYIAIKEPTKTPPHAPNNHKLKTNDKKITGRNDGNRQDAIWAADGMSNRRSVFVVNTVGSSENHFAMFPIKLILPMVLAGTSEKGCCPKCRAPYKRKVEKVRKATRPALDGKVVAKRKLDRTAGNRNGKGKTTLGSIVGNRDPERHVTQTKTVGWLPTCDCNAGAPIPCIILDPYCGSGTTLMAAVRRNRHAIGCELNPEYVKIIHKRVGKALRNKGFGLV